MQIVRHVIIWLLCLFPVLLPAQEQEVAPAADSPQRIAELEDRLLQFIDDYNQVVLAGKVQSRISETNIESGAFIRMLKEKTRLLENDFKTTDFRWNVFIQTEQAEIADNEELMDLLSQAEQLRQSVADTLAAQHKRCDALSDFVSAKRFILAQDSVYDRLYRRAAALSLIKKLAPQLERTKAREQALFEQIQNNYNKTRAAVELIPQLNRRAAELDEHYFSLKALSEKIQAMEYKPIFQRIKDELIGLACIAILLLFLNLAYAKIQAAVKLRETLRQQKELLRKANNNDYPTI